MTHEKEQISEETDDSESEPLELTKLVGNHLQENQQNPSLQLFRKVNKIRKRHGTLVFNYRYPQITLRMLFFSMVFEIYGKYHDECMGDLNVHMAIWRMFMYTTLQSLISICTEYDGEFVWDEEEVHQ